MEKKNLVLTPSMLRRAKRLGVEIELLDSNRVKFIAKGQSIDLKVFNKLIEMIASGNEDFVAVSAPKFAKATAGICIVKFNLFHEEVFDEAKLLAKNYLSKFSVELESALRGSHPEVKEKVMSVMERLSL